MLMRDLRSSLGSRLLASLVDSSFVRALALFFRALLETGQEGGQCSTMETGPARPNYWTCT